MLAGGLHRRTARPARTRKTTDPRRRCASGP